MDTTIKTAYDRIFTACHTIDTLKYKNDELEKMLAADIYAFICTISTAHAKERYSLFNKLYQGERYDPASLPDTTQDSLPGTFLTLCEYDRTSQKSSRLQSADLYISFFTDLGKYYLLSKFDKKDIVLEQYLAYLERLQKYITDHQPAVRSQRISSSQKSKDIPEVKQTKKIDSKEEPAVPEETLEELLEKLNNLIGLSGVKQEVTSLINLLKIKKIRDSRGMPTANISKHLVFLGNPGTGKTTVARLLSKIYKQLGALERGQLVEVDRSGLVAGYVGQTALKTQEKIDEAMGGILFIDEAYTLAKGGTDFGQEAIDTILKAMEDYRDNFVVIVAGYPERMESFLNSNPGLKSRFNKNIFFEDYNQEELLLIFKVFAKPTGMTLSSDAESQLKEYLNWLVRHKSENFANGREMRNIFEASLTNQANRLDQANRLANQIDITNEELNTLEIEDLPEWVLYPEGHITDS